MLKMPALFVGHGSPTNTLELNVFTREWRKLGEVLPRPEAILVISAHWYIAGTAITAMPVPRTIHDFYGFSDELFQFEYPAPGRPDLAGEIAELVKPNWVGLDGEQWGLDHGTWSVLAHMYPNADVPVLQLSIDANQPLAYHLELGAKLCKLRDQGVLILSSGNVVHNLRLLDWTNQVGGSDWAHRFDDAVQQLMIEAPSDILKVTEHRDYRTSVPTPDHFIPLLYTAALAMEDGSTESVIKGYSMGSLSMTSYGVGL